MKRLWQILDRTVGTAALVARDNLLEVAAAFLSLQPGSSVTQKQGQNAMMLRKDALAQAQRRS
jgi:hypothetical protein